MADRQLPTPKCRQHQTRSHKPLIKADRADDGSAFRAKKSMTAIPANSAAARRQTTPTDNVTSRPQPASKRLGATVNVSAKAKKLSAINIATLRKLNLIAL